MRKFSLLTAVLLLSCAWAVAQTSPSSPDSSSQSPSSTSPSTQSPSSTSPSTQTSPSSTSPSSQQPDTSATGTSSEKGNAIEGCLSGSAGNYTLTDASGTAYQLGGDTSKLADHVGHQVKVWGDAATASSSTSGGSSATGSATSSASSQQTLNVKRVKMISSSCSNK